MTKHSGNLFSFHRTSFIRVLFSLAISISLPSQLEALEYTDYPWNPVFTGSQSWNGLAVIAPSVLHEDGIFKMWFGGRNVGYPIQIGYAVSADGISWDELSSPVLTIGAPGTFDDANLKKLSVVHDNTGYKMWYTGQNVAEEQRIGLATSLDGALWAKFESNPIISFGEEGTWNDAMVGSPCVVYDGDIYKMWFVGRNSDGISGIGLAYSGDGISWQEYESNPVMSKDPEISWESEWISAPNVFKRSNGTYVMFYIAFDGVYRQIGLAQSDNGIEWVKHPDNPIISHGLPGSWNGVTSSGPSAVKIAAGQFALWYTGNPTSTSTSWYIGHGNLSLEIMGDINADSQVNIADIIQLIDIILQLSEASDYQLLVGDQNNDGVLTISDLILLVDQILE